jgi:hypothetical protein
MIFLAWVMVTHTNPSAENLEAIKAALDVATPISKPLVAIVVLSAVFAKRLSDLYHSTYVSYFALSLSAHSCFEQPWHPPVPDGVHR